MFPLEVQPTVPEREFFIGNLVVRIHFIIVIIRWTGLAPQEFEFSFPGSLISTFLKIIWIIEWIRTSKLSIKKSLSAQEDQEEVKIMAELERQKKLEREKRLAEEKENNARSAARQEENNATSALEGGKPAAPPLKSSRHVGSSQSRSYPPAEPEPESQCVFSFCQSRLTEENNATSALEGSKAAALLASRRVGSSQNRS